MDKLLASIGLFAFDIAAAFWKGFVLVILWRWFVVPVFPSLPQLTVTQAVGLALIASLLQIRPYTGEHEWIDVVAHKLAYGILLPPSMLLIGFIIVKGFM